MSRSSKTTHPPRRFLQLSVGALTLAGFGIGIDAAGASTTPLAVESAHAATLAQGVIEVGTGDHQWVLQAFPAVTAPVEVSAAGPTFIVSTSGAVRVLGEGGAGLGSALEVGEAHYVPAGHGHQLSAAVAADVLEVGVAGGSGLGTFPLTEGLYDVELVRDVLAPGEMLTVTGVQAGLVLVIGGGVSLPDGSVLPAGYNLPFAGSSVLTNSSGEPAVVFVATVSPIDSPATAGAAPATAIPGAAGPVAPDGSPAGNPTPGVPTPGNSTPGNSTPGAPTPGNSTPGNSTPGAPTPGAPTPGNSTPGNSTPGAPTPGAPTPENSTPGDATPTTVGGGGGSPTTVPTTAAPTTTPPPPPPTTQAGEGPLSLQLVSCSGGQTLSIRVDASAGSGYRRNIQSVSVSRQNNEGAYTSPWSLSWIGEHTAEHDEWSTVGQVTGQNQNMGNGLRITARSVGGQTQTINTTLSSSC